MNKSNVVEFPLVTARKAEDRQLNLILVMGWLAALVVFPLRLNGLI